MKVSLLSDYVSLIDKEKKVKAKKQAITFKKQAKTFEKEVKTFLVIVTNTEHASEVDQFEAGVGTICDLLHASVDKMQTTSRERSDYIGELLAD